MKNYLSLGDIQAYTLSLHLSNYTWDRVEKWDIFARKTIGEQFVKSVDSISANIAEGFGRYFKKDRIKFYRYSRGSVQESMDWAVKARHRNLLTEEQYLYIISDLKKLPYEINTLIKFTNERLSI